MAALDPVRANVLAILAEPGSSTTVAAALGLPRQQVNYHLRTLERHNLVRVVEERPKRGLTERVMLATARSYVLSPSALGQQRGRSGPHRSALDALPHRCRRADGWRSRRPGTTVPTRPASHSRRSRSTARSDSRRPQIEPRTPLSSRPPSPRWQRSITTKRPPADAGTASLSLHIRFPVPPHSTRRPDHG